MPPTTLNSEEPDNLGILRHKHLNKGWKPP